ncbi:MULTISPECIES: 5' nucleotidase, NT5C type [unclassified Heyndrickxia]|uniref:5' nucleotidase, NT5C type n=1 Tax=unclassified Heyndrickxia TaxID=2837518 RepID=UPI0030F4FD24
MVKKYRFGIDIDGTVTDPETLIPFINDAFHIDLKYEDLTKYEITDVVDIPAGTFADWFIRSEPVIYAKSPVAKGAKEVLNKWADRFELYFISARASHLLDVTKNWFTKQQLKYHHIELIGTHHKVETAKKYSVDLFLEDKHDNAAAIAQTLGIPVLLFDTPYNRDPVPENVYRVKNWKEADDWVRRWITQSGRAAHD